MKKKILVALASAIAFIAVFVAQISAASACFWCLYDPELPEGLK
ncbi:MAG: cyclic lactone autoinducer peptide [Firmicutes bacterium]|jgi:cyclic lactone autoinducer peptide|nr:cyclic lactone autoinducer peptide [Bacillota bacterium]HPU00352.1 cyclic lactone autoinducer peptide [Bacillota bacterium]